MAASKKVSLKSEEIILLYRLVMKEHENRAGSDITANIANKLIDKLDYDESKRANRSWDI